MHCRTRQELSVASLRLSITDRCDQISYRWGIRLEVYDHTVVTSLCIRTRRTWFVFVDFDDEEEESLGCFFIIDRSGRGDPPCRIWSTGFRAGWAAADWARGGLAWSVGGLEWAWGGPEWAWDGPASRWSPCPPGGQPSSWRWRCWRPRTVWLPPAPSTGLAADPSSTVTLSYSGNGSDDTKNSTVTCCIPYWSPAKWKKQTYSTLDYASASEPYKCWRTIERGGESRSSLAIELQKSIPMVLMADNQNGGWSSVECTYYNILIIILFKPYNQTSDIIIQMISQSAISRNWIQRILIRIDKWKSQSFQCRENEAYSHNLLLNLHKYFAR